MVSEDKLVVRILKKFFFLPYSLICGWFFVLMGILILIGFILDGIIEWSKYRWYLKRQKGEEIVQKT